MTTGDTKVHPTNHANTGGILWAVFSSFALMASLITIGLVFETNLHLLDNSEQFFCMYIVIHLHMLYNRCII